MSVCNVFVGNDAIYCVTDTMVYRGTNPAGLCRTKALVSNNGLFAFAMRGTSYFAVRAANRFISAESFDDAERIMNSFRRSLNNEALRSSDGEITLMGWSHCRERLVATRFDFSLDNKNIVTRACERGHNLAPGIPGACLPSHADEGVMVKIALAQYKASTYFNLSMCIGGVMHFTTVTRDGAEQRIVGAYPGHKEHAENFGCPNKDELGHIEELQ